MIGKTVGHYRVVERLGGAKLYKAMAYGSLIEAFEKISIDNGATFVDRPAALTEILSLLAAARADVTGTQLTTDFTGSILAPNGSTRRCGS